LPRLGTPVVVTELDAVVDAEKHKGLIDDGDVRNRPAYFEPVGTTTDDDEEQKP